MILILLSILIIINISKKEILQNYKKIIFLLFSLIPILIWKITCINYDVNNDIIKLYIDSELVKTDVLGETNLQDNNDNILIVSTS